MSKVKTEYECSFCCHFQTKKYSAWMRHLSEEGHQVQVRERVEGFSLKAKKRCAVVFGVSLVKETAVLKYFGDLAVVSNFVFWRDRKDFCIIQFNRRSSRDSLLSLCHTINGQGVLLKAREDISDIQWLSVCPFMIPKVKMETEEEDVRHDDLFKDSGDEDVDDDGNSDDSCRTVLLTSRNKRDRLEGGQKLDGSTPGGIEGRPVRPYSAEWDTIVDNPHGTDTEPLKKKAKQGKKHDDSLSSAQRERNADDDSPSTVVPGPGEFDRDLNARFQALYHDNLMPLEKWKATRRVIEELQKLIQQDFPRCVLIPFEPGFTENYPTSPEVFSVFVDVKGYTAANEVQNMTHNSALLDQLFQLLRSVDVSEIFDLGAEWKITKTNHKDNVTRIMLTFARGNVKCEIHFHSRNFISAQCSMIVSFLCSLDPRVRLLLIIAQHWASSYSLVAHGFNKLSPEVIQWLVLNYLVIRKIIPSVSVLQISPCFPVYLNKFNVSFCNNAAELRWEKGCKSFEVDLVTGNPSARSMLKLALKMFTYYGGIEYETTGINIHIAKKMLKSFERYKTNPPKWQNFLDDYQWSSSLEMMSKNVHKPMVVQHPLMLLSNMTCGVSSWNVAMFKEACINTSKNIELLLGGENLQEPLDVFTPKSVSELQCRIAPPPTPSYNSVPTKPKPNVDSLPDVETGHAALRTSETKTPKMKMLLKLKTDFREKAKLVIHPANNTLLKDHLFCVWESMVYDFNKTVWPLCFGVKLSLDRLNENVYPPVYKGVGVLVEPSKMVWMNNMTAKKRKPQYSAFMAQLAIFRSVLLRHKSDNILLFPTRQMSLEFRIELSYNCDGSKGWGEARVNLTHFEGTKVRMLKGKKLLFEKMYTQLWEAYSYRRRGSYN